MRTMSTSATCPLGAVHGLRSAGRAGWVLAGWLAAATCSAQDLPRGDLPWPGDAAAPALTPGGDDPAVQVLPALRLQQSRSPATASVPAALAAPLGGAAYWQRSMVWQRRDRIELGFGLAVLREAQPQGPLAGERGADTSSLGARPVGGSGAPAMALLALGRAVTPGVAMGLGMDLPLNRSLAGPGGAGDGMGDGGLSNLPQGELRMGLSFMNRDAYDGLRRGLDLRMELSGATALTVRPRSGRVTLQLSSRW